MFEEAFTLSQGQLIRELVGMGVESSLIRAANADTRLLSALYILVLVEALNA